MKIKSLVASALLAATALPSFGTAYRSPYNQLTWTDTFSLGQWTCRYNDAKSFAKSHNTPMIVVCSKEGHTYCNKFEREIGKTTDLKTWAQSKGYVLVYVFGNTANAEYGLSKKDAVDAFTFCTKLNPDAPDNNYYPLVGVWWPKNKAGKEVKAGFVAMDGKMGTSGTYIEQFKAAVDNLVGDYVTPTTLTVTFNANGGTIDDAEKTRLTVAGKTIGMFPAATRAGYRVTGWTTAASGGTAVKTSTKMTDGATYYAQWKKAVTLTLIGVPDGAGKLVGAGQYDEGTTVAVKTAPASKDYIFMCWKDAKGKVVSNIAKFKYALPSEDEVTLYAHFTTKQEDLNSISLFVNFSPVAESVESKVTMRQGVAYNYLVVASALTAATPSASGLPSGLKLVKDKDTGAYYITGAPTAVSKADKNGNVKPSNVTIKVKTSGGNTKTYKMAITVKARPEWTEGVFNGYVDAAPNAGEPVGLVYNLTVAANGKVSGKLLRDGLTYTLSAPSLILESGTYKAAIDGKAKGSVISVIATFDKGGDANYSYGIIDANKEWYAYQTPWKTNDKLKALAKKIAKAQPLTLPGELDSYGDLTLKFGANGVVTVKGAGASSSSVLVPFSDEPTEFRLFAYLPPKKSFPGYAARITLKWDGTAFSLP